MKKKDVPIQKGKIISNPPTMKQMPYKGKIISNPPTMKQMPYPERVAERAKEIKEIRRGQTTTLQEPRSGRS